MNSACILQEGGYPSWRETQVGSRGYIMDHYLTRETFDPILFSGKRSAALYPEYSIASGDVLRLREIDPEAAILTGRWVDVRISNVEAIDHRVLVQFEALKHGIDNPTLQPPPSMKRAA